MLMEFRIPCLREFIPISKFQFPSLNPTKHRNPWELDSNSIRLTDSQGIQRTKRTLRLLETTYKNNKQLHTRTQMVQLQTLIIPLMGTLSIVKLEQWLQFSQRDKLVMIKSIIRIYFTHNLIAIHSYRVKAKVLFQV